MATPDSDSLRQGGEQAPPTLALIAHDGKKEAMARFATEYAEVLRLFTLIGTGSTATKVEEVTDLTVQHLLSGPKGGDAQIAARVAEELVACVIFLVDPLNAHPHDPDIQGLQRICNVHNVPLATNVASAALLVKGIAATLKDNRRMPEEVTET